MAQTQEFQNGLSVAFETIQMLFEGVWQGVAVNLIKQMAPRSTAEETYYTLQSFVMLAFTEKYTPENQLSQQSRNPVSAPIDNLAAGSISQLKTQIPDNRSRVHSKVSSATLEKSHNKTLRSSRFVPQISEQKDSKIANFPLVINEPQIDKNEDKMRTTSNLKMQQELKYKRTLQQLLHERESRASNSVKLLKDQSAITFNYEGQPSNVAISKLGDDQVRKMKQQYGKPFITQKERINIQPADVLQAKPFEKQKSQRNRKDLNDSGPNFSSKALSLAQAFEDPSRLSQGIKITQLRNGSDSLTYQKKVRKLSGLKQYRLRDYKTLTKDLSFKQYGITSSKKSSMLNISASHIQNRQDSPLSSSGKPKQSFESKSRNPSEMSINSNQKAEALNAALGRNLPFIRTKGLKFYDIGGKSQSKTIQFNFSSSRKHSKAHSSHISISDHSLFEQNLINR